MTNHSSTLSRCVPSAERAKAASRHLRGELAGESHSEAEHFSPEAAHVLKHHGVYQQDDRDKRSGGQKSYSCFVRTRLPGGLMTAEQFRAELSLCDRFGNGTIRLTDRQGLQIHGISKSDLSHVIREIQSTEATTLGACGDVLRNVMCCPAPIQQEVRRQMQSLAASLSRIFMPQSAAYRELWLRDGEESSKLAKSPENEEPFYGDIYLPRKFKIGFSLPDDNCIDVLTHDLGFVAVIERQSLVGFDAYAGGGMGVTPARQDTFAAVAQPVGFIPSGDLIPFSRAVMETYRDFGNRLDRRLF